MIVGCLTIAAVGWLVWRRRAKRSKIEVHDLHVFSEEKVYHVSEGDKHELTQGETEREELPSSNIKLMHDLRPALHEQQLRHQSIVHSSVRAARACIAARTERCQPRAGREYRDENRISKVSTSPELDALSISNLLTDVLKSAGRPRSPVDTRHSIFFYLSCIRTHLNGIVLRLLENLRPSLDYGQRNRPMEHSCSDGPGWEQHPTP